MLGDGTVLRMSLVTFVSVGLVVLWCRDADNLHSYYRWRNPGDLHLA